MRNLLGGQLSYITKNGSWLIMLQMIASLSGLASSVVLTRYFTVDDFGVYRFLLTVVTIMTIATLPGLNSAIIRGVSRYGALALAPLMRAKLVWSSIGSIGLLLGVGYYWWNGGTQIALGLLVLAAALPLLERYAIYIPYRKGLEDFTHTSRDLIVTKLAQVLAVISAALLTGDVLITFAAMLLSKIIVNRLYFTYRQPTAEPTETGVTEDTIIFGKKLTATHILITLSNQIDNLCIWYFTNAATLAFYAVAFMIPNTITGFAGFLPQLALPKFAKQDWSQKIVRLQYLLRLGALTVLLLLVYGAYVLVVPFLFEWLFPAYGGAVTAALILGSMIVLQPLRVIGEQMFIAREMTRPLVVISIWEVLVFIGSFVVLLQIGGGALTYLVFAFPIKIITAIMLQLFYVAR